MGQAERYAEHSVLSSGKWYKIGIDKTGLYKLGYADLSSLGVEVDRINPKDIRVYHNGGGLLSELNAPPL
jgi:hypothetical protein